MSIFNLKQTYKNLRHIEFLSLDFLFIDRVKFEKLIISLPLKSIKFKSCDRYPDYFWSILNKSKADNIFIKRLDFNPEYLKD